MMALPSVKFKHGHIAAEFDSLDSRIISIANDMARYCQLQGVDFVITAALSNADEDLRLDRVSKSHTEGRAIDVRTSSWTEEFIAQFISRFSHIYGKSGAISAKDGVQRLIVRHNVKKQDGTMGGDHLHIQVKP